MLPIYTGFRTRPNLGDPLLDTSLDGPRLTEVVNETALCALICHPASVIERV